MTMHSLLLLSRLAWRNLWRHPVRTLIILFAFVLGIWSIVALAAYGRGAMEQQIEQSIRNLTGHIQMHAPGYREDPVIDHRLPTPDADLRAALSQPEVTAWATRVRVPAVIASERESAGIMLVGIEPEREQGLSFVAGAMVAGRYLESDEDAGLLLGRKLAERLETGLGRRVVIMSQDRRNQIADRGFRVVGIFDASPEAMETGFVFIARGTAQKMLKLGDDVSEIAIMTASRHGLDSLVARLRAAAPAAETEAWTTLEPLLKLTEELSGNVLLIWYLIVFTAMSFGLVNTLLMAVFERTREFGLFQALGMPPRLILGMVLAESLILLLLALIVGNLLAGGTLYLLRDGIDLSAFAQGMEMFGYAPIIYPKLTGEDFITANLLVLVLGIVACLYPAWRAARHVPVEAITRI